jgi:HEPN domain-containing protein
MTKTRALDWLLQAQNDFEWASEGIKKEYYSQVCFLAQQSAEKALKSVVYLRDSQVRGHSIRKIAQDLGINGAIEDAGKNLDIYYISARYPDALPEGAPFQTFTKKQASEALDYCQLIIKFAQDEFHKNVDDK